MQTLFISNEKRKRVFRYLLSNPEETIKIRKIAKELKLNPGFVSVFVNKLKKAGIVKNDLVDMGSPSARAWKILFNIEELDAVAEKIGKTIKPLGLGVYGSWARGTNTTRSDLDLWIKVKEYPRDVEIAGLRNVIRKKISIEISLLFLTEKKIRELKEGNPPLYFSLVNSFHLWGERVD